tara:strand:- start:653 stop:919 length:267 start_codon:yes stop_codon:yes gene_type:complete
LPTDLPDVFWQAAGAVRQRCLAVLSPTRLVVLRNGGDQVGKAEFVRFGSFHGVNSMAVVYQATMEGSKQSFEEHRRKGPFFTFHFNLK